MTDLFDAAQKREPFGQPLAERMRPDHLDDILGQEKILGPNTLLRRMLTRGDVPSMILWGPPGTGKTTIARAVANYVKADFLALSAVMSGVKDLREAVTKATESRKFHRRRTVLFLDEIHRFNKSQQDALLPHVESGLFLLIGATTENPSFEINAALLSRSKVLVLEPLGEHHIVELLQRALDDKPHGLGRSGVACSTEVLKMLAQWSQGDARRALSSLELAAKIVNAEEGNEITADIAEQASQRKLLLYDKAGEEHYNVVSAFIKSMRGSDPHAACYWLTRMLEAGEDPRFILRRLVIFASEDIGNADPTALQVAVSAMQAYELVGLPEGVLPLTQATTYLATAPKSNAVLMAYSETRRDVKEHGTLPVPLKLRNATSGVARQLGYGKDYKYPHNFSNHYVEEFYLPDSLGHREYYHPSDQGQEADIKRRMDAVRKPSPE